MGMKSTLSVKPVLLKAIQSRFGRNLSSAAECEELSNHIYKNIKVQISAQTLRRFFGFIQDNTEPSSITISYLVRYCGFSSLDELLANAARIENTEVNEEMVYFIKEFYNIELTAGLDFNYQKACGNIARQLVQFPSLLNSLEGFLSSNKVAQIFFFERHPYIDGLGDGYSKLIRLYAQEKRTPEAQLFAYCLLHFGSILTQKYVEASLYIQQINQISVDASIHPFVQARKIMANLLDASVKKDSRQLDEWTEIALKEEKKQKRYPDTENYFPFFQFILADAFNLVGKHDEAMQMIVLAQTDYIRHAGPIEDGYYTALSLIHAIALFHSGNRQLCKNILKQISEQELLFTSNKYYQIQKYLLELKLANPKSKIKIQSLNRAVNQLIQETGFTFFR